MISGYERGDLLTGNELFRLFRGRDVGRGVSVLIKAPRQEPARQAAVAALGCERDVVASLPIGSVLRPVIVEEPRACALVMDDPGGVLLASLIQEGRPDLSAALAVAIEVADALDSIHKRGMIHNGLRPDAILSDSAAARAWLVDFGDVSCSPGNVLSSTTRALPLSRLIYVSPERIGRMDRAVDYRSDFYSLGTVLYELLTGIPPFQSDDALELIHWHVAKVPPAPVQLVAAIPRSVSDIVMKLLAKTAEERYQSARGLGEDLRVCAKEWALRRSCPPIAVGARDVWDNFQISKKLYGREQELGVLLEAFERITQRRTTHASMMLVAGYSGVGKTSLIQELCKPIVRQKGYFIAGKFDQVVRNIPFGALIQAFRALVRQLLTESEAELAVWRAILGQALGANGGVLAEVIPEIEFIIGSQPAPVALGPTEALNRFQLVIQRFVASLARPGHPLVVFLDDLQWADPATLSLLQPLLTGEGLGSLFLIGACRDNEIDPAHPLVKTLDALKSAGTEFQQIELGPLRLPSLTQLIRDTLQRQSSDVDPLARLVLEKTGGNPFFVIQFLKTLNEEGYLEFDEGQRCWTYRIETIAKARLTDNVIDLMTHKLQRLPPKTQRALTLAACIGNPFDVETLAVVSEQSADLVAEDLEEALTEGLILAEMPSDERTLESGTTTLSYSFLHDRVQQSAYALIPSDRKELAHLTVGRLLRSRVQHEQSEERIFDIVHHLNLGCRFIVDDAERISVAELNLSAGLKAKSSTAHAAALEYLQAGVGRLTEGHWHSHYGLTFALHIETAESLYLCGHFDKAEAHLDLALEKAQSPLDRARVQNLRLLRYESLGRYEDAIRVGHEALALCGLYFPADSDERANALDREVASIQARVGNTGIDELSRLPEMSDPARRMIMKVCTNLHTSCYLSGGKTLTMLNTAFMVRLSLTYGNCEESAYAYALYAAMLLVPVQRDYQTAYEFGQLALKVNDRFPAPAIRTRVMMNLGWAVSLWHRPMSESLAISREAHRLGNENGMFVEATYALFNDCWLSLLSGEDLAQFQEACAPHVGYAQRVGMRYFAAAPQTILQWGLALQGLTAQPGSLSSETFDEEAFRRDYGGQPLFEMFFCVAKLAVLYTLEDYGSALKIAEQAEEIIRDFPGTIWDQQTIYYRALTLIALYPDLLPQARTEADRRIEATRERFRDWAENSPENFRLPHLILCAEIARLRGSLQESIELFEAATRVSSNCPREPALANELFGKLWVRRGNLKIAAPYLREARALYEQWGAAAKVEKLERAYPEVLPRDRDAASRTRAEQEVLPADPATARTEALDLFSVMKAAQAIAGEIELDRLLERLMRIAIENAGAEHGSLILEQNGEFFVNAEGSVNGVAVNARSGVPLALAENLPASIVNYVRRTSQAVVLPEAQSDDQYRHDPYIMRHRPRSVMCVPVVRQGRLIGILYLENNMVGGAFTPERIQVMQVLSTNAAISLENAELVDGLKREIRERKQAQDELRSALTNVEELKNELEAENIHLRRDMIANVSHDLRTPLASLRGYLETLLMKEETLPASQRRKYLEIAARQSVHLATMVDELFDLAKLDFKGLQLNLEPLHLGELAFDVLQKFQLVAERKQIDLKVESPAKVPFVQADVSLVERVLDNLISNALNHTPPGGSISVSVIPEDDQVTTKVADTGVGVAEADLAFIFERFYRADKSRATGSGGSGLGLAIAKRILELHESTISVESKPMAGTCFTFALPVPRTTSVNENSSPTLR
jgi:predicted ATPase/signal transduction histidine kinase